MSIEETPGKQRRWGGSEGEKDLFTAVALLAFALGGFAFINLDGAVAYPGPGGITWKTMPFIYSGGLAFLSLIYIGQSIRKISREKATPRVPVSAEREAEERLIFTRRWITLALLLTYAALMKVIGFAILTPPFLFALFRLYGRGNALGDAALSLVGGFALWMLFVPVLQLNLKGGWFDPVTPFLLNALSMVGL